jgi:acyl-CoA synthetase (AMP-forming)/AMP-acid ligase II
LTVGADFDDFLAALPPRLDAIVRNHAAATPEAIAIYEGGATYTYQALDELIDAAAARLGGMGIRGGDRVMIVAENTLALVVLMFALSRLDAWAVLINARLTAREIDAIRDHCEARRVFYLVGVSEQARAHAQRHHAVEEDWPEIGAIAVGALQETDPEPVEVDPARQVAIVLYTSGTTGTPKGVMLSHRNLIYVASGAGMKARIGSADKVYCVMPMTHVFGLVSIFLRGMFIGGGCRLVARFSAPEIAAAIAAGEITVLSGVPAMFAKLLDHAEAAGLSLRSPALNLVTTGGSPVDPDIKVRIEAAVGMTAITGYGMSEAAATISRSRPGEDGPALTAGQPLDGLEIGIVAGDGRALPLGEVGDVWVRGPSVMLGYFRDAAATAAALTEDGWLRTGDLGRIDADGNLHIVDRSKDIIIRSGFNVSPVEVEGVLNAHPGVLLSAVVPRPVAGGEEDIVAFVQPAAGAAPTEADLLAYAADELAAYKRPSRIVVVDTLPASSTGKILKAGLKDRAAALA